MHELLCSNNCASRDPSIRKPCSWSLDQWNDRNGLRFAYLRKARNLIKTCNNDAELALRIMVHLYVSQ